MVAKPVDRIIDYRREATVEKPPEVPAEREPEPPWTVKANELLAAGWESKVEFGMRVWCRPGKAFRGWYSEDHAHRKLKGES